VKDVAVAMARVVALGGGGAHWHLSPPLGEVRAGCQLELVRSVGGLLEPERPCGEHARRDLRG
jgi:hypothetical protein